MGDVPSPLTRSPPSQKSNLPMFYYALVVVGTTAFVLAVYSLNVIRWCSRHQGRTRQNGLLSGTTNSVDSESIDRSLLSSFKYKKGSASGQEAETDQECVVCLSVFEEGEVVRQLPRCNHSFHAQCIDMWLYSHYDCPLCRTLVSPPLPRHPLPAINENSREGLQDSSNNV